MSGIKKWLSLFSSNFLGVYNDNLLKYSLIFYAVHWALPEWFTLSTLISIFSACLVIPYLIFTPLSGNLALKYSKQRIFRLFKLFEIPTILVAGMAIYFHWIYVAIVCVFIMGTYACLYSPSKYGLIRDIGGEEGLSFGNGIFEMLVYLGILIGLISATQISNYKAYWFINPILITVAIGGYLIARTIKVTELPPEQEPVSYNPLRFVWNTYRMAKNYELVNIGIFGASVFWLIGGLAQSNIIIHCRYFFHSSDSMTGLAIGCASVGIALGCFIASMSSRGGVNKGIILIGIMGMLISATLLSLVKFSFPMFLLVLFVFSMSGGVFQIPCLALVQHKALGRKVGDVIAYLNFFTFGFVLLSSVIFYFVTSATHENSFAVFGTVALLCAIVLLIFILHSSTFRKETVKLFF
jgi:MFS family permease